MRSYVLTITVFAMLRSIRINFSEEKGRRGRLVEVIAERRSGLEMKIRISMEKNIR